MSKIQTYLPEALIDNGHYDHDFPPGHCSFRFMKGSEPVFGHAWSAQGRGRKGCLIISHQTYGGDNLESVIIPLLRCGINAISFEPTGMWDRTQPTYSMYSAVDDVHALIEHLRARDYDLETPQGQILNSMDTDRIALFGLSGGGGNVSFAAAAESPYVHHAIAAAPANMDIQLTAETVRTGYDSIGRPWYADASIGALEKIIDRVSITRIADRLVSKHLLMIGGAYDTAAPIDVCHAPLAKALRDAGAQHLSDVILESDHLFLTQRNALASVVISWLRSEASF